MSRTIHVDLPRNINDQDVSLFRPHVDYELQSLDILNLHEAFVTYTGLCIDETGVRKESYHDYFDKRELFINDAVVQFKEALGDSRKLVELDDDETYLLIHHPWASNYWHWITEVILRVWMVRDRISQMILILPDEMAKINFVQQSLAGFKFKDIYYIPEGKHLLVRNLCVPEVKRIADSYFPEELREIREHFLKTVRRKAIKHGHKIYISRKKSLKRTIINEDEVEDVLRRYGFNCINNEDFDFNEQIDLYSQAKHIVSIHGAGLTNMIFMQEGSSVLELHKKRTNRYDWHSFAFWYLAGALEFRYHHQVCDPDNAESTFFAANLIVDIELLERNILFMLRS
jgi:capsular polysaccharide biosynthesis protein